MNPVPPCAAPTAGNGASRGVASSGAPSQPGASWAATDRRASASSCCSVTCCGSAAAAGALYYDRATKPDLGTPDHVTRKYLEAYLEDRDEQTAKVYQCGDGSGLSEIHALRNDIDSREKQYGITFTYSVGGIT